MKLSIIPKVCLLVCVFIFFVAPLSAQNSEELPDFLKQEEYEEELSFEMINLKSRTRHTAQILWETNHPAAGKIRYSHSGNKKGVQTFNNHSKRHEILLENLREGTQYSFRVYAWDHSDHRIKSQLVKYKTKGMAPPEFKRVWVSKLTMFGGIIRWVTNVPTTAKFKAGYDTPYEFTTTHDEPTTHHQVNVKGFYPNRKLSYQILAQDTRGRTAQVNTKQFKTREPNVALKKPVEGTFDRKIFGVPERATGNTPYIQRINDGDFDYSKGTANSEDPADTDQWFTVNLKKLYTPDTAVFYWRDLAFPREYEIYGSPAGVNWRKLAQNLNATDGERIRKHGLDMYRHRISLDQTNREFQFIKVVIPQGASYYAKYDQYEFVQLIEFKLFPEMDHFRTRKTP